MKAISEVRAYISTCVLITAIEIHYCYILLKNFFFLMLVRVINISNIYCFCKKVHKNYSCKINKHLGFSNRILVISYPYVLGMRISEQDSHINVVDLSISVELIGQDIFFEIIEPEDLRYTYRTRPAKNFGPSFNASFVEKNVRLVPVQPANGCMRPSNGNEIKGNIALIERGHCSFVSKTIRAEEAGARGVIIADNKESDEYYTEMIDDFTGRNANIPATFLLGKNGFVIRKILQQLNMNYALINIPVNVTYVPLNEWKQPPWLTW